MRWFPRWLAPGLIEEMRYGEHDDLSLVAVFLLALYFDQPGCTAHLISCVPSETGHTCLSAILESRGVGSRVRILSLRIDLILSGDGKVREIP